MDDGGRQVNYEGFWRSYEAEVSALPWPQPAPSWSGRERFLACLAAVETAARGKGGIRHYMGFSTCRLCGKPNGTSEYSEEHWRWPEGFQHYVREHGVRPSPDFERFILER
jgi:hypothetical protein